MVFLTLICVSAIAQRIKFNINPDWRVHVGDDTLAWAKMYDDHNWKLVSLPYAWNEDDAFKKDIHDLRTGSHGIENISKYLHPTED